MFPATNNNDVQTALNRLESSVGDLVPIVQEVLPVLQRIVPMLTRLESNCREQPNNEEMRAALVRSMMSKMVNVLQNSVLSSRLQQESTWTVYRTSSSMTCPLARYWAREACELRWGSDRHFLHSQQQLLHVPMWSPLFPTWLPLHFLRSLCKKERPIFTLCGMSLISVNNDS